MLRVPRMSKHQLRGPSTSSDIPTISVVPVSAQGFQYQLKSPSTCLGLLVLAQGFQYLLSGPSISSGVLVQAQESQDLLGGSSTSSGDPTISGFPGPAEDNQVYLKLAMNVGGANGKMEELLFTELGNEFQKICTINKERTFVWEVLVKRMKRSEEW